MTYTKNILDYINYDVKQFSKDFCNELSSEETESTVMIVYEKIVRHLEFGLFDVIQFHIFFDKQVITTDNIVNIKFLSSKGLYKEQDIEKLVNKISKICGVDNNKKEEWDNDDLQALKIGKFKRVWTIGKGESFLKITNFGERSVSLSILFANNIIDFVPKHH